LRKEKKKGKEEREKQHEQATEIAENAERLLTEKIEMLKVVLYLMSSRKKLKK
jgi:hypothetical protein